MSRSLALALTASAPMIWGTSYLVTTNLLPEGYPLTAAVLRALPAGLLLMLMTRSLPPVRWLGRLFVLGGLNFSVFWSALFIAAYRLPGGVAATLGAIQPLIVLYLSSLLLGTSLTARNLTAAVAGIGGVALLVLGPEAQLDGGGVIAALVGAVAMAMGSVLPRRWQPPVSALTFAGWQLTAGGVLLLPVALFVEPALPPLTLAHAAGFVWLGLVGAALGPAASTPRGFLSPLTAVLLGWVVLGQARSPLQILGALIVMGCVALGGGSGKPAQAPSSVKA